MTNARCPIHSHDTPDYDTRAHEVPPSLEEQMDEFADHFDPNRTCHDHACGYCYEEWELRQRTEEDILLEEDYYARMEQEECTCA